MNVKKLIVAIVLFSLFACNPFITKDLREKNRCNRKVERELKRHNRKVAKIAIKCPDIITERTIIDTVLVEIPKVDIDSFIVIQRDTAEIDSLVNLIKNKKTREVIRKYITEYIPFRDTLIHLKDGFKVRFYSVDGNIHYSIDKPLEVVKKENKIVIKEVKEIPLTVLEKIMNFFSVYLLWILVAIIVFFILKLVKKFFL